MNHSQCIVASLASLSVLACLAKCGHHVRRSESGMALGNVCWSSMERDVVCNTPCMVVSVVTRHLCDSHACYFALTHNDACCSLRPIEECECTMHIACFHLVVALLV